MAFLSNMKHMQPYEHVIGCLAKYHGKLGIQVAFTDLDLPPLAQGLRRTGPRELEVNGGKSRMARASASYRGLGVRSL